MKNAINTQIYSTSGATIITGLKYDIQYSDYQV